MRIKKGFSMMELMVTTIIIGILATLSVTYYTSTKENVADSEAKSNLKNIQVAEKSYRLDNYTFYPDTGTVSNIGNINTNLKLSLPTTGNYNWNYLVKSTTSPNTCCVQATRNGGNGRSWFIQVTDSSGNSIPNGTEPTSGSCP